MGLELGISGVGFRVKDLVVGGHGRGLEIGVEGKGFRLYGSGVEG